MWTGHLANTEMVRAEFRNCVCFFAAELDGECNKAQNGLESSV